MKKLAIIILLLLLLCMPMLPTHNTVTDIATPRGPGIEYQAADGTTYTLTDCSTLNGGGALLKNIDSTKQYEITIDAVTGEIISTKEL